MSYPEIELATPESVRVFDHDEAHDEIRKHAHQVFEDWWNVVDRQPHDSPLGSSGEQFTQRMPQPCEIAFEGILRVNGYVAGILRSSTGHLVVDAAGTVDADIFVPNVTIHGCVRGDVRATQIVELAAAAKLIGDIQTLKLSIEPGATFEGRCAFLPRSEAASSLVADDLSDPQGPTG